MDKALLLLRAAAGLCTIPAQTTKQAAPARKVL